MNKFHFLLLRMEILIAIVHKISIYLMRPPIRTNKIRICNGCGMLLAIFLFTSCINAPHISCNLPTPILKSKPSSESTSTAGHAYYVSPTGSNTNNGSQAYPFKTIQEAANIAQAGAIIHVLPGTYTDPVSSWAKGTATARITFISDIKWEAKIKTRDVRVSWTNYGNYINIQGFDITGDGEIGINNYGSFVDIIGNHVHDYDLVTCGSTGGSGIDNSESDGNHDNDIIGNTIDNIGPPLTKYCNLDQGIYDSTPGGHIFNNIVYRIAAYGIHMWHMASNITIANNLVFECGRGGIIIAADQTLADNFLVVNNISIYNHELGIYEYGRVGKNNRYLDNLVFANPINILIEQDSKVLGTLTVNPQLINYQPDGSGNYHLRETSPAIDAGTSIGAPTTDIDGISRPQGRAWDIGPYEYITNSSCS